MATIVDIKDTIDLNIRQKTLPGTITKTNHAAIEDSLAEELRVRGVIQAASTGELDEHSHLNTLLILVHDVGVFIAIASGASPDNDITFASFDSGWLWKKVLDAVAAGGKDSFTLTGNGTYTLAEGFLMDLLTIKPSTAQTQKVGLTLAGEEIMEATPLLANVTKPIQVVIVAEGTSLTLYFTGITASTLFTVYKRKA